MRRDTFLNHHMPSVNSFAIFMQENNFFKEKMYLDSGRGLGREARFGKNKKGTLTRTV